MRQRVVRPSMKSYIEVISFIERIHYDYLCVIEKKLDLVGATDLNSIQAVILLHIGDAKIMINQVRTTGNYLGSNMSYIIKKLVENGYLLRERSSRDLRIAEIRLSEKAVTLCDRLSAMHEQTGGVFPQKGDHSDLERTVETLQQIEQFWIDRVTEYFS